MSLPAMLVAETVGEILQASEFAREIVSAVGNKTPAEDPKTPMSQRSSHKKLVNNPENTQLKARRNKEKKTKLHNDGSPSPSLQRPRSRINFKVSPPKVFDKENKRYLANRVSPRNNRPWVKKTVLFPNPLFSSSSQSHQQQQFCKTRSPIISRNRGTTTPHKFLIKSPTSNSKFQVRLKSPTVSNSSPTRTMNLSKNSPKRSTTSKFCRSFSPSRLATRLVSLSPLKSKKTAHKSDVFVSGLKQRPTSTT